MLRFIHCLSVAISSVQRGVWTQADQTGKRDPTHLVASAPKRFTQSSIMRKFPLLLDIFMASTCTCPFVK